ncbi:MAG: AI-2E family transporter [Nitrospirae bacterium]|nr:AI-2E family transporter [Nitrospirota bacterium]
MLNKGAGLPVLTTLGWLVVVVAGMRAADSILVPLLLSVFLAVICAAPVFWLEGKGIPSGVAVLIVMLGVVGIGVGIGAMIGTSVNDFSEAVPRYQARLHEEMGSVLTWLQSSGIEVSTDRLAEFVDPGAAMTLGANMLKGLGEIFTNMFLIFLTVIFMLVEACSFTKKIQVVWGEGKDSLSNFTNFTHDVQHFLAIKTVVSIGTGLTVGIWVAVLGVDFPVLWGVLAFLLNYIPNLGSIIAGTPAVLLAFIQFGLGRALMVAAGYVVINIVFGNVIEPKIMGQRLGLSTLTVFLSLVFWGWVWGPVGMILSVPLTMVVKIALESKTETRWIALLLGSERALKEAVSTISPPSEAKTVS